jgi:hypothetical protein
MSADFPVADKPSWLATAGGLAFWLYSVVTVTFMWPYFEWQLAQHYSFTLWLFLGTPLAMLKAVLWPIFLFVG